MFGPYRLGEVLGRGGTGVVRSAYDTEDESEVALKILEERYSLDEAYRVRFEREAAITAQLRDPHVVPIHDFGTIDGRLFLGMRLIDGSDLATIVARSGKLGPDRAVAIVEQVASALDSAHQDGLVHRDVKPSNVLVAADDFCYVLDFGVAHTAATSAAGAPSAVSGSPAASLAYLAPERFVARPFDHRVDVYALACLLYELLTGRTPFAGGSLPVLLNSHLNLPPPRPSEQVPGLPAALDDVIGRGMAKDPDDRHPSAGAFAHEAREALSDRVAESAASPSAASPLPATSRPPAGSPPPATRLPATPLPATSPLPPSSPTRPSRRQSLSLVTLAIVVGAGTGLLTGPAAPVFEPVEHSAVGAFSPDHRTAAVAAAAPAGMPAAPRSPVGIPLTGDTGDLYASPRGSAPCDRNGLATYLTDRPELAETWSREANSDGRGPGRGGLDSYFATLTTAQLRSDTHVVEHGLEDGKVVSSPVVLQAGSAVLVDKLGLPRVRCLNGNPLTLPEPASVAQPPSGEPWPGYDPAATISVTPAESPIAQFSVVDPAGVRFRRESGSTGEADIELIPSTGGLTGSYRLVGQQSTCTYNNCGQHTRMSMILTIRDCDARNDGCQIAGSLWEGTVPLRREGPGWRMEVQEKQQHWGNYRGRPIPTALSISLTPGNSGDVAGVWRMLALGGSAVNSISSGPGYRASASTYVLDVQRNPS